MIQKPGLMADRRTRSKQMRELVSRCPRGPRSGADVGREVLAGEGGAGGDEGGGGGPGGGPHARVGGSEEAARWAGGEEPVEQAEQLLDVGEVQAGGRLVEDVDAALLGHVGGQREPLTFAPGPRRER